MGMQYKLNLTVISVRLYEKCSECRSGRLGEESENYTQQILHAQNLCTPRNRNTLPPTRGKVFVQLVQRVLVALLSSLIQHLSSTASEFNTQDEECEFEVF